MPAGRPPKTYSDKEAKDLGEDLLKWAQSTEGKEAMIWVDWYMHKGMFRSDWKALIQRTEFLPYYEMARQILNKNIVLNKNIAQSYGNRYLSLYDDELNEHEEKKRQDAKSYDESRWQEMFQVLRASKEPAKDKES